MSEIPNKNLYLFVFPSESTFDEVKDTIKRAKCKRKVYFSFHFRVGVSSTKSKVVFSPITTKLYIKCFGKYILVGSKKLGNYIPVDTRHSAPTAISLPK